MAGFVLSEIMKPIIVATTPLRCFLDRVIFPWAWGMGRRVCKFLAERDAQCAWCTHAKGITCRLAPLEPRRRHLHAPWCPPLAPAHGTFVSRNCANVL